MPLKFFPPGWSSFCLGLLILFVQPPSSPGDDEFKTLIDPFLRKNCFKCHIGDASKSVTPKGDVDLALLKSSSDVQKHPELIGQLIEVLDSYDMPPESEPEIEDEDRQKIISLLKKALTRSKPIANVVRVRRLNRFQYNNAVRDLFQLDRNVFALPEKLMTRHTPYLVNPQGKMPDKVSATSQALNPQPGLRDVKPFPKDLRAAHGYDNQSNQLTMSPLLLDAFLRLSVSIVESPDFDEKSVGIWHGFFHAPETTDDMPKLVRSRVADFLNLAFRGQVTADVLERYVGFANRKLDQGMPYTEVMKKVASAALSSPLFLFRTSSKQDSDRQRELASNLSFLLWSSIPDKELLQKASDGKLGSRDEISAEVERMLADPKIERFLDTFPAQWLQLENVLAATPDPQKQRLFSVDKDHPASLQMLIEPLLLFDAAFLEDWPLTDLVQPKTAYRSEFLKTWYTSDLKPRKVDSRMIVRLNELDANRKNGLLRKIDRTKSGIDKIIRPVHEKLLREKMGKTNLPPVDLKPIAAWEFGGNLKASVGDLDLESHGDVKFENGMVVLDKSYLLSKPIPIDLKEKTLEVWAIVHDLDMRGGGLMGIQGNGDFFDTIVLGERKPRHWISGSNGFSRTLDFNESTAEDKAGELIHLVMVYQADGSTLLYRNGIPYGKPFKKSRASFPKNQSRVIFGLRHLPPRDGKYLKVSINSAMLYDRALTAEEVRAANKGQHAFVSDQEVMDALTEAQRAQVLKLRNEIAAREQQIKAIPPPRDPNQVRRDAQAEFDNQIRSKLRDPVFVRSEIKDQRFGGLITNAAIMSMTSGPKRSHPIARGAWLIEVIFNDPPPPPPNDVPPLNENSGDRNLTIRERFREHRSNPDCAGCHSRLDPLGFAMENFDLTGRWRDLYENGRQVDMKGTWLRKYAFNDVVQFKNAIVTEKNRFAKAFTQHLLRFALTRELSSRDRLAAEQIVSQTEANKHSVRSILKAVILSDLFLNID